MFPLSKPVAVPFYWLAILLALACLPAAQVVLPLIFEERTQVLILPPPSQARIQEFTQKCPNIASLVGEELSYYPSKAELGLAEGFPILTNFKSENGPLRFKHISINKQFQQEILLKWKKTENWVIFQKSYGDTVIAMVVLPTEAGQCELAFEPVEIQARAAL